MTSPAVAVQILTPCRNVDALLQHLHASHPWWPTALTVYVPIGGVYGDGTEAPAETMVADVAAEPVGEIDPIELEAEAELENQPGPIDDVLEELAPERRRLGNTAPKAREHVAFQGHLANTDVAAFLMNSIQGHMCGAFMLWETDRTPSPQEAVVLPPPALPAVNDVEAVVGTPAVVPEAARAISRPPWLHSITTREEATAAIEAEGALQNGRFLVYERPNQCGEFIISVVFKGTVTHHLARAGDDGIYAVNKKTFGDKQDIAALVQQLGTAQKGWPVALDKPVWRQDVQTAATGVARTTFENAWMAVEITSKDEATVALNRQTEGGGLVDGMFLAWARPNKVGSWVISVVFKVI